MAVTYDIFTANFPEFSDFLGDAYPVSQFNFWLSVATLRLDPCRWGDLLDLGTQLFIAHNMVQAAQSAKAARLGTPVGATVGVLSAKAIDKVSASYDVNATTLEGAGNYNATTYGVRYWELVEIVGAGGAQLW